jgi:hypothetical protein
LRLPATACLPLFHARPGQQVPARPPASPDCPGGPGSVPGPAQARGRSSSSAAAAWSVAPTPNLDDSTGVISAVSCPSASACTAVGYYDNGAGTPVALAEGWNGTAWAIQSAPDPDGAQGSYLDGVSCSSASACTAVGYYVNSAGATVTLAEGWNGTAWAIQSTSNPSGAEITVLDGVSCPSATACTAAGYDYNSAGVAVTLAESWNGTAWAIQTTPNPGGTDGSGLAGVSCTLASACTAVGFYYNSAGAALTLAERWNGTAWAVQTTPNPSGAEASYLDGISCTSASACTAVGYYDNSAGTEVTLAERWNGTAWAIQKIPNPSDAEGSALAGVSCTSASACTAAGSYYNSTGLEVTLAEGWNGTDWAIQSTINPNSAKASELNGVSCAAAAACTTAGYYDTGIGPGHGTQLALAEGWNGTDWATQTIPSPSGAVGSALAGVSCTSASACTAVGYSNTSSGISVTLAERWNGAAWVIQKTPGPSGVIGRGLAAVSCTSASACIAVGNYEIKGHIQMTLAEVWNGTAWAVQTTPNPSGAEPGYLDAISCTSASACTAVGYYVNSAGATVTLAEVWNGTAWAVQTTPNPSAAVSGSQLSAVSCTSASACTAVGAYFTSSAQVTLAERWNGTAWTIQTIPNPGGGGALNGVSCPSASACTADGSYFTSSGSPLTLAERWNGKAWAVQTTPNPKGAGGGALNGVSCTSASACTAAGYSDTSKGIRLTLAEVWNGTAWAIQTTPSPSAAVDGSYLNGLSCPSVSACTAAGTYLTSSYLQVTLAESYS